MSIANRSPSAKLPRSRRCARLVLLSLLITAAPLQAAQYIRDIVYVPLRSGPSMQHRILANLSSGDGVEVVDRDPSGYVQVETAAGDTGWLEEQYLVDEPVARDRLDAAQAEAARLRQQADQLQQKLRSATEERDAAADEVAALQQSEQQLAQELAEIRELSAGALELRANNEALQAEAAQLRSQSRTLQVENVRLSERLERNDFMNGAYAVAIGMVLTLIVPRLWPRRRRSEWG